jgi:hypothetical protein
VFDILYLSVAVPLTAYKLSVTEMSD